MAYYMYCPLDLTVKQQHIYTLLFSRSEFKGNYRVACTIEQLAVRSDECFELTDKMVRTIVKQLIDKNYLKELSKGKKGVPTVYEICVDYITSGKQSVTNMSSIGNELVTNDKPMPTITDAEGNELVNNVSSIGNEKVNLIIKKEENEEKEKKHSVDYDDIFNHYLNARLINHKKLTVEMKKGIDVAIKNLGCDIEEMKRMIDRHKEKSIAMKDNDKFKVRSLSEFFGQKKWQSVALICSDYSDDVYEQKPQAKQSNPYEGMSFEEKLLANAYRER